MTLLQGFGFWASSLSAAAPGMVLLTPSSITHSGTSASIGANGQVTFTAVTSLSLNGVFSADFDNYVVAFNATTSNQPTVRLRLSGTDATGSNYVYQVLDANNTTIGAGRGTDSVAYIGGNASNQGIQLHVYGPALAQPTAFRAVNVNAESGARLYEVANTHSLSTAYDGFTIAQAGTGALAVYGIRS